MKQIFDIRKAIFLFTFLCTASISWSQLNISGTIIDGTSKEPLIGANIIFVESEELTITDLDGKFEFKTNKPVKTIRFSYIGYEDLLMEVTGKDMLNLNVELSAGKKLDEILIIGYGTIQKSDKTGSLESIKPKDADIVQYRNFQDYLQGRASGLQITANNSELGGTNSIRIRGANSLRGDNEPLYVIDGIIVNSSTEDVADPLKGGNSYLSAQNGLTGLNAQDIESVEILKDASATAIYGSRGANGVIIITTKKGRSGKTKFNFNTSLRVGQATRLYPMLNADQFTDYINSFRKVQGFEPTFYKYADGSIAKFATSNEFMEAKKDSIPRMTPINWYDDILQNSVAQSYRLSAAGGSDKNTYYVGFGYNDATGITPGTRLRAGDFLLKYSHQVCDRITISPRISATYSFNNASKGTENLGSSNASLIRQIVESAPLLNFADDNPDVPLAEETLDGPRAWLTDYNDDSKEFRSLTSLTTDIKISEIFTYRLVGGMDYRNKDRSLWYGINLFRGRLSNGEAGIGNLNRIRYNVDNTLMFNKKIGKNNRLNGTIGVVFDETYVTQTGSTSSNFSNLELRYDGISFGQTFIAPQFFKSRESIISFLGRANYSLKNKYLLTFSFRADGSSKFLDENRFSFFPSASVAWKIIEEPFMQKINFISDAKIRIGYGRTGSQAINPYQTLTRFAPTANLYPNGGGGGVTAILPQNLGNSKLTWETTDQFNVGIDFGIMKDRITGSLEVYHKKTIDLLQLLRIGPSTGFSNYLTNIGDLQNRGVDFSLSGILIENPVRWKLNGTFSLNRGKILNLGVPESNFGGVARRAILGENISGGTVFKVPANIFIEGEQPGLFWGYKTSGIIESQDQLASAPSVQGVPSKMGDILYVDSNKDGNINEQDLDIIGNPNPQFTIGLGSELEYKKLKLSFFINSMQGFDIANGNRGRQNIPNGLPTSNITLETYNGLYKEGQTGATFPRVGYEIKGDFTDRMVEEGSFTRLSFVSLGYTTNKLFGKNNNVYFYVSANNLLLLTKYSGFDPEVNSFSFDPTRRGIDWSAYPNQKTYSVGLNMEF